jgi:hypothetical protein
MKKLALFGALGLALSLTSCKKDWDCVCSVGGFSSTTVIKDSTRKEAKDSCSDLDTQAKIINGSCSLK